MSGLRIRANAKAEARRRYRINSQACDFCGGLHFGSHGCVYKCLKCGGDTRIGKGFGLNECQCAIMYATTEKGEEAL